MGNKSYICIKKKLTQLDTYYRILGLQPGAGKEEVKRAYRRLAKKYHPDVALDREDHIKFRQIKEAYEILTGKQSKTRIFTGSQASTPLRRNKSYESAQRVDLRRRKFVISKEEWLKRKEASERIRRKNSEESYKYLKTGLFWALIFTAGVNILYPIARNLFNDYMVQINPEFTVATIIYAVGNDVGLIFSTNQGEKRIEMRCNYFNETSYLPNGFPAIKYDIYQVSYNRNNPKYYKIDFLNVHESIRDSYIIKCIEKIENNPKLYENIPRENIPLFVQNIYDELGVKGLAMIYHRSTRFYRSLKYNSLVYYFFKNNKIFKEVIQKYIE